MTKHRPDVPRHPIADIDEALDDAAQGMASTSDDDATGSEIDAIGSAAGISDAAALGGTDPIAARERHRAAHDVVGGV